MTRKRLREIPCPKCPAIFRVKKGGPRTLKQWKASLMMHLTASRIHHLEPEEAERILDEYLKKFDC